MKVSNIRRIKKKIWIETDVFFWKTKKSGKYFSVFLKTANTLSGDLGGI